MRIEIGQIISQIFAFLILLWVLKRYAWQPILKVMDDRTATIKAEFDAIETQKNELTDLIEDYKVKLADIDNLAHSKMSQAIEQGRRIALEIQDKAHDTAKAIVKKAQEDSVHEMQKAKEQLKDEIVKMTLLATEKMLQNNINQEKQKGIISDFIKQTEA